MKAWTLILIVILSIILPGASHAWDRQIIYDCTEGTSKHICTYSENRSCFAAHKEENCSISNSACDFRMGGTLGNDYLGDLRDVKACRDACIREVTEGECANPSKWQRH